MNHERAHQLKKAKISPSEELVERMKRWGWINVNLSQIPFREINQTDRSQYFELIEVESIDEADVMMIHGRTYPIKESDVEKLKKAQRREQARHRGGV